VRELQRRIYYSLFWSFDAVIIVLEACSLEGAAVHLVRADFVDSEYRHCSTCSLVIMCAYPLIHVTCTRRLQNKENQ
jgi:hypothetical protein